MADQGAPWMGDGTLQAAMQAITDRRGQINGAVDAASGMPPVGAGQPPPPVDSRQMAAGALLAGSQSLGARGGQHPQMTSQQQAQLVQMLRARGLQRPPQGPPGMPAPGMPAPPQPGMPAPGGIPGQMPPLLQQAPPMPGQQ